MKVKKLIKPNNYLGIRKRRNILARILVDKKNQIIVISNQNFNYLTVGMSILII